MTLTLTLTLTPILIGGHARGRGGRVHLFPSAGSQGFLPALCTLAEPEFTLPCTVFSVSQCSMASSCSWSIVLPCLTLTLTLALALTLALTLTS